jgi:hypothetical protein
MSCIDPWLVANHTCPLCNRDILENEMQPETSQFGRTRRNSFSAAVGAASCGSSDGSDNSDCSGGGEASVVVDKDDVNTNSSAVHAAIEGAINIKNDHSSANATPIFDDDGECLEMGSEPGNFPSNATPIFDDDGEYLEMGSETGNFPSNATAVIGSYKGETTAALP